VLISEVYLILHDKLVFKASLRSFGTKFPDISEFIKFLTVALLALDSLGDEHV
jgi:hypothetical protein